jgi:glycosyltransferase involved in cell wall biosynthesis
MAAGTPVIALKQGGAIDSVDDGASGILFAEPTVSSLVRAVRAADDIAWDRRAISDGTRRFGEARFRSGILEVVDEVLR